MIKFLKYLNNIFKKEKDKEKKEVVYNSKEMKKFAITLSPQEMEKIEKIKSKVGKKIDISQTKFKMKELYFQRILYDYIMLNQGILLPEIFKDFEEKPIYISKMLKNLKEKNKIYYEKCGNLYKVYVRKTDFSDNLILKKIKNEETYQKVLHLLSHKNSSVSFLGNVLNITCQNKNLKLYISNWRYL